MIEGVLGRSGPLTFPVAPPSSRAMRILAATLLITLCAAGQLRALEHVTLRRDGREQTLSGQVMVRAEDGGLLLATPDGTLWAIEPDELVSRREDQREFQPLARDELARQLTAELPSGFDVLTTHHYLICYNTSREYAGWCGALFERLHKGFTNFWTRKGFKLRESEFPLVAIIFNTRESYLQYSQAELGKSAESIVGYYSLRTNRITMYDLTGIESLRGAGDRRGSQAQINLVLSTPDAEQVVATVIHEATHQIAFNSGLQTRFADIPLWVSEGIAVYFESPDLQNSKGWRTIGALNTSRLDRFRDYLSRRPQGSLTSLVSDDHRMRDARSALDAYAEAWALNYYLIHHHAKQYLAYLQILSEKKQLVWDNPQERLKDFQTAFGESPNQLDADFLRQMQKVR